MIFGINTTTNHAITYTNLFEIKKVGTEKRLTLLVMNNIVEFESKSILEIQSDFSIDFSQE